MTLKHFILSSVLVSAFIVPAAAQQAAAPGVTAVFAWTEGDNQKANKALNDAVKAINVYANNIKGNVCKGRVMVATFAGVESGTYLQIIECPSMDAFVKNGPLVNADPQFQKMDADIRSKLQAAGGKLTGSFMYEDVM